MKKLFLLSVSLIPLLASSQEDSTELEMDSIQIVYQKLPDSTSLGTPIGNLISKEIGPSGGSIWSEDRKAELIFPEGVLQAATKISIQTVSSTIQNTKGMAYQFEPSGIQFAKPVQLVFHLSDQEMKEGPIDLKFLAVQNSNGKWEYRGFDEWDSTSHLIKVGVTHFSAYANGNLMEIDPIDTLIKLGTKVNLQLKVVTIAGEDDLWPLPPAPGSGKFVKWVVSKGANYGTVSGTGGYTAIFKAPSKLPPGPAIVKLHVNELVMKHIVQRAKKWRGETTRTRTETLATYETYISFFDEYAITITTNVAMGQTELVGAQFSDQASFNVKIYPKGAVIDNVKNYPPKLIKPPPIQAGCKFVFKMDGADGPLHISDRTSQFQLTGNSPVTVSFYINPPQEELIYFYEQSVCKKYSTPLVALKNPPMLPIITFPVTGQPQVKSINTGRGDDYRLDIKPIR